MSHNYRFVAYLTKRGIRAGDQDERRSGRTLSADRDRPDCKRKLTSDVKSTAPLFSIRQPCRHCFYDQMDGNTEYPKPLPPPSCRAAYCNVTSVTFHSRYFKRNHTFLPKRTERNAGTVPKYDGNVGIDGKYTGFFRR